MAWWEEQHRFTTGYLETWRTDSGRGRIVATAALVGIVHLFAVLGFAQPYIPLSLAVPLAALLGPAGVWGVAIGAVLGALATGAPLVSVLMMPIGAFLAAIIGRTLWLQLAYPYRIRPFSAAAAIFPLAIVGSTIGVSLYVGGLAVFEDIGFATTLPTTLWTTVIAAGVLAPVLVGIGSQFADTPISGLTIPPRRWLLSIVVVSAITALWLVATLVLDFLRTDLRANPDLVVVMVRQLPPVLDRLVLVVGGRWGWIFHAVFAIVAVALIAATLSVAGSTRTSPIEGWFRWRGNAGR